MNHVLKKVNNLSAIFSKKKKAQFFDKIEKKLIPRVIWVMLKKKVQFFESFSKEVLKEVQFFESD